MSSAIGPAPHDRGRASAATRSPRRWRVSELVVSALLTAAFAVLTAAVAAGYSVLLRIDSVCVLAANALVGSNVELRVVATVVSDVGSPVAVDVVVGVVVLTLLWRRRVRAALVILLIRLVELGLETLVKVAVDRPRPWVPIVVGHASGSSFPSGHAAGSSALVVALLALLWSRVGRRTASVLVMSGVLICLAIGVSRVLLGVHYPSDVVGGLLLGTVCAVDAIPWLVVAGEVVARRGDR